jgi:hypothetical protein
MPLTPIPGKSSSESAAGAGKLTIRRPPRFPLPVEKLAASSNHSIKPDKAIIIFNLADGTSVVSIWHSRAISSFLA